MPPIIPVPSLSTEGWITDNLKIFDNLLGHMFVSDLSHSTTCPNTITSFSAIFQKYKNDLSTLENMLEEYTRTYLRRYVPNTDVKVEALQDEDNKDRYRLNFTISANNNGEIVNLVEGLEMIDGKFSRVASLNNG